MKNIPLKAFIILTIIASLIPISLFSQTDTSKYPIFDVTCETGVLFPQSEAIATQYKINSCFQWSMGIKFGSSDWKFLPWLKHSTYKSNYDTILSFDKQNDNQSSALRNQISFGLINPIPLKNNHFLQLKYGLTYNFISEEASKLYDEPLGIVMSVGYMNRVSKYFTYYLDLGYDHTIVNKNTQFKDWGGMQINFGISLNLGIETQE